MRTVAVVGTSVISTAFIKACRDSGSFLVKAVVSRNPEKGKVFCETYQIETLYTSFDDCLSDPSIDLVYLASPNDLHYPQAKLALSSGKDVISEKPMVSKLEEALELRKLAHQHDRFIVEAITSRFMPNLQVLKDHLNDLGPIRLVQIVMPQYSSRYTQLKAGQMTNVFDPAHSGGALYDIGIYTVSLVVSLFGKPQTTRYSANLFEHKIDTSGILTMDYPDFKAVCLFGKDCAGPNVSGIYGEKGCLQIVGAPSSLPKIKRILGESTEDLSLPQQDNPLYAEVIDFAKVFETRDRVVYEQLMDHSFILAEILENSRKQVEIVFTADTQ